MHTAKIKMAAGRLNLEADMAFLRWRCVKRSKEVNKDKNKEFLMRFRGKNGLMNEKTKQDH
jgi:hypothetical protein